MAAINSRVITFRVIIFKALILRAHRLIAKLDSWAIDNNVITTNRHLKPHEIFGEKEVIRYPGLEDIFQKRVQRHRHQVPAHNTRRSTLLTLIS